MQLLVVDLHVWPLETNTEEDGLEALLSQLLESEILAKFFPEVDLHTELLNQFDLPEGVSDGSSVFRDLMGHNTTSNLILFKNVNVIVAHSS